MRDWLAALGVIVTWGAAYVCARALVGRYASAIGAQRRTAAVITMALLAVVPGTLCRFVGSMPASMAGAALLFVVVSIVVSGLSARVGHAIRAIRHGRSGPRAPSCLDALVPAVHRDMLAAIHADGTADNTASLPVCLDFGHRDQIWPCWVYSQQALQQPIHFDRGHSATLQALRAAQAPARERAGGVVAGAAPGARGALPLCERRAARRR